MATLLAGLAAGGAEDGEPDAAGPAGDGSDVDGSVAQPAISAAAAANEMMGCRRMAEWIGSLTLERTVKGTAQGVSICLPGPCVDAAGGIA